MPENKKKKLTQDEIERLKGYAKSLFVHDKLTQKEIAEKTGISAKTIGVWVEEGGWKKLQKNFMLTREEIMSNLLDELAELVGYIKSLSPAERIANYSKLGDARRKLVKDIKELETSASLPETIAALKLLLDFTRKIDLKDAQHLSRYCDGLIKSLLK